MPRRQLSSPLPGDLWAVFGDLGCDGSLESLEASGAAQFRKQPSGLVQALTSMSLNRSVDLNEVERQSKLPLRGFVSISEDVPTVAHALNACIGVENSELLAASELVHDKRKLYKLVGDLASIEKPAHTVVDGLVELQDFLTHHRSDLHELIIKPALGTESRGIIRPAAKTSPEAVIARLIATRDVEDNESFIIMPFFGNKEYCADGVVCNGAIDTLVLHEKAKIVPEYPIQDRLIVTPPTTNFEYRQAIADILSVVPCRSFVFHLELRMDVAGRLMPIDLALRPGGGLLHASSRWITGVDLKLAHIRFSLGQPRASNSVDRPKLDGPSCAMGAFYSNSIPEGKLRAGLEKISQRPHSRIQQAKLEINVKSRLALPGTAKPDVGLCIAVNASAEFAVEVILQLAEELGVASEMLLTEPGSVDKVPSTGPCASIVDKALKPVVCSAEIKLIEMSSIQETVSFIFREVVSPGKPVSYDDSFFDLGGNSLTAGRLLARIAETIGIKISFRTVFDAPTVRKLALHIYEVQYLGEGSRSPRVEEGKNFTQKRGE